LFAGKQEGGKASSQKKKRREKLENGEPPPTNEANLRSGMGKGDKRVTQFTQDNL